MPTYVALYHVSGESDYTFSSGGQQLTGAIVEFDGTLEEAREYFARQAFYGGDESAKPEDYKPRYDGFGPDDPVTVVVAPYDESMRKPLDGILGEHNAIHRKIDADEQEKNERAELERLQGKYS